jgi:hypothetical protein
MQPCFCPKAAPLQPNLPQRGSGCKRLLEKKTMRASFETTFVMTDTAAQVALAAATPAGRAGQKYSWSQTLQDVSVCVSLPAGTTSKMLDVVIQRQSIKVGIKGGHTFFCGPLSATVQPDECFWTLEKGSVEITLNKVAASHIYT